MQVIGKVSLRKEDLSKYHQQDQWFPLTSAESEAEIHGKVHLEIKHEEYLNVDPDLEPCQRMAVK